MDQPDLGALSRAVLDALPATMAIVVADGTILHVNAAWRAFATANGVDLADVNEGVNYFDRCRSVSGLGEPEARAVVAEIKRVIADRVESGPTDYACHAPTEERWFTYRVIPLDIAGVAAAVVFHRDVSEERRVRARERESLRSLALAQATAHLGDWTLRPGGSLLWSAEMFRLHDMEVESSQLAARPVPSAERLLEYVHPQDRERVVAAHRQLVQSGAVSFPVIYRTNPSIGRERTLEAQGAIVRDASGRIIEWHGTVLDVTERERRNAELRQHQTLQSVGLLAGGIAHDFNNILSEIIGFAGFVRNALDEADPRRADIMCVLDAAGRAAAVTRELLAFSRQQPRERHPTDLNQQLARFSPLLRRTVGEHIEMIIEPPARPAVVLIDPAQFDQLVLNLVSNARDAMAGGGTLRLSIRVDGADAVLRVTDNGSGMDDATQQRVCEPFLTTKATGHGSGLGLATWCGIVEEAGGSIRLESAVGIGSTFVVTLPLILEATAADAQDPGPAPEP